MRVVGVVVALLTLLLVFDPGAFGGLVIIALPLVLLRGIWLFAGDVRRIVGPRR